MHSVLLIDELIREIFQWSYVQDISRAALTCRAWKEPALDALYNHLTSLKPLLDLPETEDVDDYLKRFHSYARRVRHLTHSTKQYNGTIPKTMLDVDGAYIFPYLRTARINLSSRTPCSLPPVISMSPQLRELQLDEGFYARKGHDRTADYLKCALDVAPRLQSLTLRGFASLQTNAHIAAMRNLHTLRLRTSHTLSAETLASIARFPHLSVLEVHAKDIASSELQQFWGQSTATAIFPVLENLWIRCRPDLFALLVDSISSQKLHTLNIDLETRRQITLFWDTIFDKIRRSLSMTLQDLSILHLLDHDDVVNGGLRAANTIHMKDLQYLSHCRRFRRLDFGTTLPVNVCDADFAQMVKWWPDLQSFEISSEITNDSSPLAPRITFETLRIVSTSLPKLAYLALPVDTAGITEEVIAQLDVAGQRELATLSIMFPHLPDVSLLPRYLYILFPNLPEVEYTSEQWFADWVKVTSGVRGLQLRCDKRVC